MKKKKINKINKETNRLSFKKIVYIVLTIFLGKLLGLIAFALVSINLVAFLEKNNLPVAYDRIFGIVYSPLPAYLFWLIISIGAIGGFFLGLTWWRIVYVEHRHWRMKRK